MSIGAVNIIPTLAQDVVAIFKQSDSGDDAQVLTDATLMRASIDEHVTFFRQPLENGRSLIDHRIIQPVTIDLTVITSDSFSVLRGLTGGDFAVTVASVYEQIKQLFVDGTLLSIQTRTGTYRNQLIQAMPHQETPDMFNGVTYKLALSEIQFETANVPTPAAAGDSDSVGRGKQNPAALASALATTVAARAVSIFGG